MTLRTLFLFGLLLSLLTASPTHANADVGPRSSEKETCTVDQQCVDGQKCRSLHGEIEVDCAKALEARGFALKCNARDEMSAVYCPKDAAAPKKGMCQKSSVAGTSEGRFSAVLALTVLAAVVLRRGRWRQTQRR